MHLGVNVPNYGPGTDPGVLREWGRIMEGLGFDLLTVSDHVVITADVAVRTRNGSDGPAAYAATMRDPRSPVLA